MGSLRIWRGMINGGKKLEDWEENILLLLLRGKTPILLPDMINFQLNGKAIL